MTPREFIESLLRHYAKRHPSDEAELEWHREMVEIVGTPRPDLLRKAYEIIRAEHEERAFPLPATIKKAIDRACAAQPRKREAPAPAWTEPTDSERARVQALIEEAKRSIAANQIPDKQRPAFPDVARPTFEAMQRSSVNAGLHMTREGLSDISRRITGEHQEDAA